MNVISVSFRLDAMPFSVVMTVIETLAPLLSELEEQRQLAIKKRSKGFRFIGVAALVWFGIAVVIISSGSQGIFGLVVALMGFGVSFAILHGAFIGKWRTQYERDYKERVLTEVTKSIQSRMRYKPHDGISESLFKSSGLIKSRIDRYHSEDLFLGTFR